MSPLAPTLQLFFTERLLNQRQASPATITSYRRTFELLLRFVRDRTGKLLVNLDSRVVSVGDQPLHLTAKEYGILELLSLRKGTTLTKEMFLNHLYGGMDEPELKIIDVFVCKLRKKLAQATGGEHYIETVWGRGYVLRDPVEAAPELQRA